MEGLDALIDETAAFDVEYSNTGNNDSIDDFDARYGGGMAATSSDDESSVDLSKFPTEEEERAREAAERDAMPSAKQIVGKYKSAQAAKGKSKTYGRVEKQNKKATDSGRVKADRNPSLLKAQKARAYLDTKIQELEALNKKVHLGRQQLKKLEKEHELVTQELSLLTRSDGDPETIASSRKRLAYLTQEVARQRESVETNWEQLLVLDQAKDAAEVQMAKFAEEEAEIKREWEQDTHEREVLSKFREKQVERAVRQMGREAIRKLDGDRAATAEATRRANEHTFVRRDLSANTKRARLEKAIRDAADQKQILDELQEEQKLKQIAAVISLKKNTEAAMDQLKSQNERNHKRREMKEYERAKERVQLIAIGQNPDAVFNVREEKRKQELRVKRLKKKIHAHEMKLLDTIIAEDEVLRKEEKRKFEEEIKRLKELQQHSGHRSMIQGEITKKILRQQRLQKQAAEAAAAAARAPAFEFSSSDDEDGSPGKVTGGAEAVTINKASLDDQAQETRTLSEQDRRIRQAALESRKRVMERKNAKALQRARDNFARGKKLVVCGKEYDTSKFIASPAEIVFQDFTVGKEMTIKVELTNVSFTFNSFKVLKLDDSVMDFFKISYTKPGRMSAGLKCVLTVTFTPKTNEDVLTELPFLAETGPFSVPLKCFTKKAVISVVPRVLDFGAVVRGEEATKKIVIKNDGALDCDFRLVFNEQYRRARGDTSMLHFSQREGVVMGYSTLVIDTTFAPDVAEPLLCKARLLFGEQQNAHTYKWGSENVFETLIKAEAIKVPVFVESNVINYQVCLQDKLYRAMCRLHNRSSHAHKVIFNVPKALKGSLVFIPSSTYVQAHGSFDVQCRWTPSEGTLPRAVKYGATRMEEGESVETREPLIDCDVRLDVVDHAIPIILNFQSRVVSPHLEFDAVEFDFGSCFITQAAFCTVTITNPSPLLQKCSFNNGKFEFNVLNPEGDAYGSDDQLLSILPYHSVKRNIVFRPKSAIEYDYSLTLTTLFNHEYKLRCVGVGKKVPIVFGKNTLVMPTVPNRERCAISTLITNTSKTAKTVEFGVPPTEPSTPLGADGLTNPCHSNESFLTVVPRLMHLLPGETARAEVQFHPDVVIPKSLTAGDEDESEEDVNESRPEEKEEASPVQKKASSGSKKKKLTKGEIKAEEERRAQEEREAELEATRAKQRQAEAQQQLVEELERKAKAEADAEHKISAPNTLPLSSVVRYTDRDALDPYGEPWSRHGRHRLPVFFRDAQAPSESFKTLYLQVTTTTVFPSLVASPATIDFGQVGIGGYETLSFELKNFGPAAEVVLEQLELHSPFQVINAVRPMSMNSNQIVVVQFYPKKVTTFVSKLVLRTSSSVLTIPLRGRCVAPEIKLIPDSGELDLGDVMVGHTVTASVVLDNVSEFPFEYNSVISVNREQDKNWLGSDAFSVAPGKAVVSGLTKLTVTCTFSPDHPSMSYGCTVHFGKYSIKLRGRAHTRQLFVNGGLEDTRGQVSGEFEGVTMPNPLAFLENETLLFPGLERELNAEEHAVLAEKQRLRATRLPAQHGRKETRKLEHLELSFKDKFYVDFGSKKTEGKTTSRHLRLVLSREEEGDAAAEDAGTLLVGACALTASGKGENEGKKTSSSSSSSASEGSFEVSLGKSKDAACFSVNHSSGKLATGQQTELRFAFSRSEYRRSLGGKADGAGQLIDSSGHWVRCKATIALRGGAVPSGASQENVHVSLDVFLRDFS